MMKNRIRYFLITCILVVCCKFMALGSYTFCEPIKSYPLCIESVIVRHYPHNSFVRISEFFTGRENTGGQTILRTDELYRAGIYLVVELNQAVCSLPEDTEVIFQYVLSNCQEVQKNHFEIKSNAGSSPWLLIGVTGLPYLGLGQTFLAWSLEIRSNGQCVTQKSFLWEMEQNEELCD